MRERNDNGSDKFGRGESCASAGVGRTRTDWATRRPWPSPQDTHVMKCPRRERRFVPPFYALPTAALYILAMLYIREQPGPK